jgi:hypothetical protein
MKKDNGNSKKLNEKIVISRHLGCIELDLSSIPLSVNVFKRNHTRNNFVEKMQHNIFCHMFNIPQFQQPQKTI